MEIGTEVRQRLNHFIDRVADDDPEYVGTVESMLMWGLYGQRVFSQFGYSVYAWNFRQDNGSTRLCVKAVESGVPLVAFISSASTTGCVEQMFELLECGRLKWQKDKYPAI